MSKAEIIAELSHLSEEDLAEVRAWLDRIAPRQNAAADRNRPVISPARIRTPRLADSTEAAHFKKRVTELPADATI